MKKLILVLAIVTYTVSIFTQIGTHIPSDRLPPLEESWWEPVEMVLPWQNAGCLDSLQTFGGLEITNFINVITDLDEEYIVGNNLTEKIQFILDIESNDDNYSQSLLFYFPPGEYEFDATIEISRNNVVFKGSGAREEPYQDQTIFHFVMDYDYYHYIFTLSQTYSEFRWVYQNCFQVSSGQNNIGFEDFKLIRTDNQIYHEETNPTSMVDYAGQNFLISGASYIWISGIHSYHAPRHHISIGSGCDHIEVRGCYINKSIHRSDGGYGVVIGNNSHHCLIENNVFRKLRHSMIFGNHAYYNVLGYNYSRENDSDGSTYYNPADICFHGHSNPSCDPPEYNLAEGNKVKFIWFDKAWGENGINNLIFRNKAPQMCDWVLNLLYPNDDNDNQLIVNNYFYGSSVFAWDMHGEGHLKKNNKCEFGDNTFWIDYSPYYWQDISYYHASQPDFMPFEQWPYDPIDSESSNPARDRWIAGYHIPVLAQWNHLNLNEPSRDQYSAYFYNNIDPITGDIQKELSIVYLTYYNQSTQMEVTIEQNSDIIGDWNNKVVDLCAADHNQYIPAKRFVERIILSEVTFDDIVITIDDYDTSNKIITEPYDYSGYPPFPIFHTDDIDRDMIYATYSGAYSGGVYFGMPHVLKFRLPYNGSISINNDNDFGVSLKDGNISHSLISSYPPNNYADFNTNGTISVDMPSVDVCIGWGLNEYNISLYIDIDVNGFNIRNRVSFDGLIRMGYGYGTQSDPFFCVSEYNGGAGCPTLYSKGELENNLVSLAENQSEDAREYKLLRNRINHNDLSFTVSENQDNINYFDYTGLISVGHPENETIGVTGCGEFFSYDLQREIRIETGRDSIFVIPANDSIIISLDEYTLPQSDEVFLKLTCMKYNSRAMADKGDIDLGDTNNRDSTYVFDVVGIYENLNTSYSQLPEYLITQGYGNIIIKPSKDIEVHGISFVMDQSRNNNNLDIQSCSIISAHSLKNGSDVRSLLLFEDEDYFEFGKNGGFGVTFDSPTIIGDKIDYIFVSKGRYRNQLNEDIISNKLDFSNYPNPFNPETTISFSIHEASKIELSVYNIKGQKVKVIVNDEFEKGTHNIVWNGEDSNDKRVGSGVYFYKLKVNGKEKSVRKCLLIK